MHADLPQLRGLAERQGGVVTREQARQCGCPEPQIRRLIRAGDWAPVRRGLLAAATAIGEPRRLRVAEAAAAWLALGRAAHVVAASDALAESPLETLCRLLFARHGLPVPERQALVVDPRDGWHARVDFCWPRHRTVVEADGRLKYATPADLWNEKLRQERIEEAGYAVLRVTWPQVTRQPAATVARVLRAFVRGARLGEGSGSPTG